MATGSKIHLEGELNKANLNVLFAAITQRIDALEGKTLPTNRTQPLNIEGGRGKDLLAGGFTLNQHGDDLEQASIAKGAYLDDAGQWIATLTQATIITFNGSGNVTIYVNTGLTPGAGFTPTSDTVLT